MPISVVTPAHDEAAFLPRCIESLRASAEASGVPYEHIVVVNRCTDDTERIARDAGCVVVHEDARNLSRIRNAGAARARYETIATIDADSWVSSTMLGAIERAIATGRYVGGGVFMKPERWSPGIACSLLVLAPFLLWHRVSCGLFWCRRADFDAIGGFDESLICVEDIDFAKRLRAHGRETGRRYRMLRGASLTTSCRKFDQFGDWLLVRRPSLVVDLFRRRQAAADEFYYDARTGRAAAPAIDDRSTPETPRR